jgi:aspartyl-tRNA(Asn)/glutamyl-tRNA(Gln) amidotransferase subunit C
MSKITKSEIKHIANLARLKLSESEIEKFSLQISEFLKHAEKIQEVDTTGVLETSNVTGMINSLREDKVEEGLSQKEALSNAPESNDGFFVVKKYHGNQRNTR